MVAPMTMLARTRRVLAPTLAALTLTFGVTAAALAAPPLTNGDLHAVVTVEGRPLSDDKDHVVAFTRGKVLYVCVQDLRQMVSGSIVRHGKSFTVQSFKGDSNSKAYTFTIGSTKADAAGLPVVMEAPVLSAYGHLYIPLSFFGRAAVPTTVQIAPDARRGNIELPPGTI
jgi:hypothetical protein